MCAKVVLQNRYRCYPILDENGKVAGTLSRYHLLRPRRKRVVLVDHNEAAQSVPGLEQAEVVEIIDHHRLADIQTANPIYFRNEPVGSTATIIAGMYQEKGIVPTDQHGGPAGLGHRVGHGHVQVAHLHRSRPAHGRVHGAHRRRFAGGAGLRHLRRVVQRQQVRRGAALRRLQGIPHRRAHAWASDRSPASTRPTSSSAARSCWT